MSRREKVLRVASVLALVGLALMLWGLVDPHAMPVLVGLTIGQAIGTGSFLLFLIVIAADLHIRRRLAAGPSTPPPPMAKSD